MVIKEKASIKNFLPHQLKVHYHSTIKEERKPSHSQSHANMIVALQYIKEEHMWNHPQQIAFSSHSFVRSFFRFVAFIHSLRRKTNNKNPYVKMHVVSCKWVSSRMMSHVNTIFLWSMYKEASAEDIMNLQTRSSYHFHNKMAKKWGRWW